MSDIKIQQVILGMDVPQISDALFEPEFQKACLKSPDPSLRLRYLEAVLSYNTALTQPKLIDNLARDICFSIEEKR